MVLIQDEKTPLHIAAEMGLTSVVELLIDKFGSSIRARTKDGQLIAITSELSTINSFNNGTQHCFHSGQKSKRPPPCCTVDEIFFSSLDSVAERVDCIE